MKRACVIGYPVSHSRSPVIHSYWLKQLGLDGSYEAVEVKPENAQTFIRTLPESHFAGCNVTIPHKELACNTVEHVTAKAKRINSVNTIYMRDGSTHGTSTDGEGFVENVLASVPDFSIKGSRAVVLGAGGSASAIIGELIDRGCGEVSVVNRTVPRAQLLAKRFGAPVHATSPNDMSRLLKSCDLLINTTSQGMNDSSGPDVPLETLPSAAIVSDIVYVPLKTDLILRAEKQGLRTVTGLGMLLHQAVTGFELWFGERPIVTQELHQLVAGHIEYGS